MRSAKAMRTHGTPGPPSSKRTLTLLFFFVSWYDRGKSANSKAKNAATHVFVDFLFGHSATDGSEIRYFRKFWENNCRLFHFRR